MSEFPADWTTSQKVAFGAIQRGVEEGLTATSALSQYRAGGGAIRDAYWYSLYRETFAQTGVRENVKAIPYTYTVPDTMFQSVDWDLRETYAMQMQVRGWSDELVMYITKWTTVESETLLTKYEWKAYAQMAVDDTIGSPVFKVEEVLDWNPLKRSGELAW